ncbi:hypothetical protein DB347_15840 [Opitutaceae bacterium EW11]|nr:hypothetical protein DB347_15840 [Opitutaceae bacterium EW11]
MMQYVKQTPSRSSASVPASGQPSGAPVLLTLDAEGHVVDVSRSAEVYWTPAKSLIGVPVVSLFSFGPESVHSGPSAAQWELLRATAVGRPFSCSIRTNPPAIAPKVVVRLEESGLDDARYFAQIESAETPASNVSPMVVDSGLALLSNEGPVGFFDLNFKAGQVYYSPAWKRMLGYNDTELANTYDSWLRLLHPEDSAAAPDHTGKRAPRSARSFAVEVRMLHRHGNYIWVHCLGTQVYGSMGELERVTGLQIDITERKELEEQTLANEERMQRLVESGDVGLFDLNFASQQYWFSPHWRKLIGSTALEGAQALKDFVEALPSGRAMRGAESFFVEPNVGHPSFITELRLIHADGSSVSVLFGAHRQLSRKGELVRAVGFACALPDALPKSAALPFGPALLQTTLDSLGEGIVVADAQGIVTHLNARAERLIGLERRDARGRNLEQVFRLVYRDSRSVVEDPFETALSNSEEGRLFSDHALVSVADASLRNIVWSARRVADAGAELGGIVIIFRDPEEMSLSPDELLKINRFENLGIVAGGISHDFNNLLTTILGGISQAKDSKDYSYLADSERACLAAKALTKQLLAVARGGKSEVVQTIPVQEVVRDAVRLARAGTNAEFRIEIPDSIHPIQVDRAQILQVFQNLIINSLQALPPRGGSLWLSGVNVALEEGNASGLSAGSYVRIEVRDNGCGIAPENLELIFEPFFTTKKSGTGLGLSMVRSIVRKFGGDVSVTSTLGAGTTFQVLLPRAATAADAANKRVAPSLRFGTGRVLLMDDDPDICHLAEGMLASLDYKYDIARNGEEAITLYRRHLNIGRPYDAVILDLTIVGGAGGEETFHKLREMDKDVRAIVCSGYDSEDMIRHYTDMGFSGYLSKPFRAADLGKTLKSVIG